MKTKLTICCFILLLSLVPFVSFAQTDLVKCGGTGENPCDFAELVSLAGRILNWLISVAVALAAVLFAWAGIKYISAGGDPGKIAEAHDIFKNVLIGFIIVLAAWLIVFTIKTALLSSGSGIPDLLIP